jgi:predicted NBD/HSP70 family sugar kinase
MKSTGDQYLVKQINRSVLLRLLRLHGGLSRAQLAQRSGLTKSTVTQLVRELIDEAWLTEANTAFANTPGRPSTPLHINEASKILLGVEVRVESLVLVAVSLTGRVLYERVIELKDTEPTVVCKQVAAAVAQVYTRMLKRGFQAQGLGIGIPGVMDTQTGLLSVAPNLGWRQVDLLTQMRQALAKHALQELPLHIQNEADTAALSEYEFSEHAIDSLIFVTCGVGIGAGIVLNDQLFTGARGMAGEIGHSVIALDGPPCSCGRKGCFEVFLGSRALAKHVGTGVGAQYLGLLLQNLWTTFNPAQLVVGGPSCVEHASLLADATQMLANYAQASGMPAPIVQNARYGMLASAVGAAAMVLHHDLRPLQTGTRPNLARHAGQPK